MNIACAEWAVISAKYVDWAEKDAKVATIIYYSLIMAGLFGVISYILMSLTLRLPAFRGPSYLYHKSMAIMEILHMGVMVQVSMPPLSNARRYQSCFQAGICLLIPHSETKSYVVYRDLLLNMWVLATP